MQVPPASKRKPKSGDGPIEQLRCILGEPHEAKAMLEPLKPDFWAIVTVLQAADMVMWPLQKAGEEWAMLHVLMLQLFLLRFNSGVRAADPS